MLCADTEQSHRSLKSRKQIDDYRNDAIDIPICMYRCIYECTVKDIREKNKISNLGHVGGLQPSGIFPQRFLTRHPQRKDIARLHSYVIGVDGDDQLDDMQDSIRCLTTNGGDDGSPWSTSGIKTLDDRQENIQHAIQVNGITCLRNIHFGISLRQNPKMSRTFCSRLCIQ